MKVKVYIDEELVLEGNVVEESNDVDDQVEYIVEDNQGQQFIVQHPKDLINKCLCRLKAAYDAGPVNGKDGDYAEFDKIAGEYPDIAHEVAVAWWGD